MSVSEMASCNGPNGMDHICSEEKKDKETLKMLLCHTTIQSGITATHKGRNNNVNKCI